MISVIISVHSGQSGGSVDEGTDVTASQVQNLVQRAYQPLSYHNSFLSVSSVYCSTTSQSSADLNVKTEDRVN